LEVDEEDEEVEEECVGFLGNEEDEDEDGEGE